MIIKSSIEHAPMCNRLDATADCYQIVRVPNHVPESMEPECNSCIGKLPMEDEECKGERWLMMLDYLLAM